MTTERETQYKQGGDMDAQLEIILQAYAVAEPGPSRVSLAAWIREYPQFALELTDFTARWQLLEWADNPVDTEALPASSDIAEAEEESLILRGISAAQSVFFARRAPQPAAPMRSEDAVSPEVARRTTRSEARIDSLITAAGSVGLTFAVVKERLRLSEPLLQKLNRRLIEPSSIPFRIVADLSAILRQQVEAVMEYTARAPTIAVGAQHRASQAPTLPSVREDFFDAVRNDAALSDARKQELLALPRPDGSGTSREG